MKEDGLYLLCTKGCKKEWEGLWTTDDEWGNHQ
jgi:hypothetical protein